MSNSSSFPQRISAYSLSPICFCPSIDSEIEILTLDRKELFEKYAEKIDIKTLKQAMRVQAIKDKVSRKDTFDTFVQILEEV